MALEGTIVFASGRAGDIDIFTLELRGGEVTQLTSGPYTNDHPRWSPDGATIAFISNRTGLHQIWLMNADGTNQRQLTHDNVHHAYPVWHPDGKSLICCANYSDKEEINIWQIGLDGGAPLRALVEKCGVESEPTVSPDGAKLVFAASYAGNYDLWELPLAGGDKRQITTHPARDYAPSYSPDGKFIAFISTPEMTVDMKRPSTNSDVWLISTEEGSAPMKLTTNRGADMHVSWSPDGQHLVYCAGEGSPGSGRLALIDLERGELSKLRYDRAPLEQEIGAVVKDYGLFSTLTPDRLQRAMVGFSLPGYFGSERYPHWKR